MSNVFTISNNIPGDLKPLKHGLQYWDNPHCSYMILMMIVVMTMAMLMLMMSCEATMTDLPTLPTFLRIRNCVKVEGLQGAPASKLARLAVMVGTTFWYSD